MNSICRFLKFMILLREETPKQLAKLNKTTMGCVVNMNTDLIGQNFPCQKHDPPSEKKNNERLPNFSQTVVNLIV